MAHRLHQIFGRVARLPKDVGTYRNEEKEEKAGRASRKENMILPEWQHTVQKYTVASREDWKSREQLHAEGMMQACSFMEIINIWTDTTRRLTVATSDFLPQHSSKCSDAPANQIKMEAEESYRSNSSMIGTCVRLLESIHAKDFENGAWPNGHGVLGSWLNLKSAAAAWAQDLPKSQMGKQLNDRIIRFVVLQAIMISACAGLG